MSSSEQRLLIVLLCVGSAIALKKFSGIRQYDDSDRRILYHDQTIAVVEYGKQRLMYTCELIEVQTEDEKRTTMDYLRKIIPQKPLRLKFEQMIDLMKRCSLLPEPKNPLGKSSAARELEQPRTFSNFAAIFPGTKWCGSGDIAKNYFDLGDQSNVDKCCRAHDICPTKVLGNEERYGVKNDGWITISHCACDQEFHSCLKKTKNNIADSMGGVYFNLLGTNCVYRENNRYVKGKKPRY